MWGYAKFDMHVRIYTQRSVGHFEELLYLASSLVYTVIFDVILFRKGDFYSIRCF